MKGLFHLQRGQDLQVENHDTVLLFSGPKAIFVLSNALKNL